LHTWRFYLTALERKERIYRVGNMQDHEWCYQRAKITKWFRDNTQRY